MAKVRCKETSVDSLAADKGYDDGENHYYLAQKGKDIAVEEVKEMTKTTHC